MLPKLNTSNLSLVMNNSYQPFAIKGFLTTMWILVDCIDSCHKMVQLAEIQYSRITEVKQTLDEGLLSFFLYSQILGVSQDAEGLGCFTQPLFVLQMQNLVLNRPVALGSRKYGNYLSNLKGRFGTNFPHNLRNPIGTENCACGTKDMFLQL